MTPPAWLTFLPERIKRRSEMKQRRLELDQAWIRFQLRDADADRAVLDARIEELFEAIMAANPAGTPNSAHVAAEERASVEQLARQHIWLPSSGLDKMQPDLEDLGFCFRGLGEELTLTLFPEGWEIVPAIMAEGSLANSSHASLVDPDGRTWAYVFFRNSITADTWSARITRA